MDNVDVTKIGKIKNKKLAKEIFETVIKRPPPKNKRNNVGTAEDGRGMCLGIVDKRTGTTGISNSTIKRPELWNLIQEFGKEEISDFKFTSVQVNLNLACKPHIDGFNIGDSIIVALGNYTGGKLVVDGKSLNIKNTFYKFNGSKLEHYVTEIKSGDRVSLVFFKVGNNQTCKTCGRIKKKTT